jgi:hypothetical protein
MRRIPAMALAISLLLLGGCAGSRRAEKVSMSAAPRTGQPAEESVSVPPPARPAGPCLERHGFAVFDFRALRDSFGQVSVIGEVKNVGTAARGVELQAALRDAAGRVVAVGHLCPASNRNIVPGETWPFTYSFGRQEDTFKAELRIVGSFRTMDILNTP